MKPLSLRWPQAVAFLALACLSWQCIRPRPDGYTPPPQPQQVPPLSQLGSPSKQPPVAQVSPPYQQPIPPAPAPPQQQQLTGVINVSPADAKRIGRKIWINEAAGTVSGLTAWNKAEYFASLGIGHFIWYPANAPKTYVESFPQLLAYLQAQGVRLPNGLTPRTPCPWPNREAFMSQFESAQMRELRGFLEATVAQQTQFIILRMQTALPKMQAAAPPNDRARIGYQFYALSETPNGVYALIDYVNFKGEGTSPEEQYRGQGWGLLQVLQGMQGQARGQAAAREFAASAKRMLGRRIANAPRNESQYRTGWFKRCDTYAKPF